MFTIGKARSVLYTIARYLGDLSAVLRGRILQRIERRLAGRLAGRLIGKLFR
jgi:hypothetical protein